MAQSFLKLDTRRPLKDGTYPVVFCVGYGRNMYIPTGISAAAENWSQSAEMVTGKTAKSANAVLRAVSAGYTARILELRESGTFADLDNKQLRFAIQHPEDSIPEKADKRKSLLDVFRLMAAARSGRTAAIYESTVVRLRRFCDPSAVHFEDINRLWLDGFAASMSDLAPNTRSIHLRNLRAVVNYAIDCGLTTNYAFRRYKLPTPTTRKRSFGAAVLRRLTDIRLGWLSEYRDIFMLTFYLIGINFIDLCGLTAVEDGRVNYVRAKTHKPYSIKVEPEATEIIERLRGRGHLLSMLDRHKSYRTFYNQLSRNLEKIRQLYNEQYPDEPIAELTTYWARHSWATIAASLDIPKETIAAALGHDMGNSTTAIYIDFDRRKIDEANRRVIDYVLHG